MFTFEPKRLRGRSDPPSPQATGSLLAMFLVSFVAGLLVEALHPKKVAITLEVPIEQNNT